jgi:hypothetical protein
MIGAISHFTDFTDLTDLKHFKPSGSLFLRGKTVRKTTATAALGLVDVSTKQAVSCCTFIFSATSGKHRFTGVGCGNSKSHSTFNSSLKLIIPYTPCYAANQMATSNRH